MPDFRLILWVPWFYCNVTTCLGYVLDMWWCVSYALCFSSCCIVGFLEKNPHSCTVPEFLSFGRYLAPFAVSWFSDCRKRRKSRLHLCLMRGGRWSALRTHCESSFAPSQAAASYPEGVSLVDSQEFMIDALNAVPWILRSQHRPVIRLFLSTLISPDLSASLLGFHLTFLIHKPSFKVRCDICCTLWRFLLHYTFNFKYLLSSDMLAVEETPNDCDDGDMGVSESLALAKSVLGLRP